MIAVGFEDDSFITYYLEVKDQGLTIEIIPIMRILEKKFQDQRGFLFVRIPFRAIRNPR